MKFSLPAVRVGTALLLLSVCRAADVPYFADNGYGNPISVMHHPAAEHFNGVTYVAYAGPHEDPHVAAYDHQTKTWKGPVKAGVNPMGKSPDQIDKGELDNHGRPSLVVDRQGYIHLVFGGHGGERSLGQNKFGLPGKGRFIHAVSEKPGDISRWKILDNISPFGTYSQWVKTPNGDLYLFYRHGSHRSDWVYQKSTDDGRTFSPQVSVLKNKLSSYSLTTEDAWYAWFENGKGDTITAHYVYHACANPGHVRADVNAYFMVMNTRDGSWATVKGEPVKLPVTKEYSDKHTLVWDSDKERTSHGTARVDADGNPHFTIRGKGLTYMRWLGDAWQKPTPIAVAGQGVVNEGDFIIDSSTKIRALLTSTHEGTSEVGWWNSADGGLTWAKGAALISSRDSTFEPTSFVRNAHPDARMLITEKKRNAGHLYCNMYLIGDHGPLGRPAAEASHLGDRLEQIKLLPKETPKMDAKRKKRAAYAAEEP